MSDICPTVRIKTARGSADLDASAFDPDIHELWGEDAPAPKREAAPPLPLPSDTDPLDALPEDWRDAKGRGIAKLKNIAEAISGRTPADGAEAKAMIEAALAEREAAKVAAERDPDGVPGGEAPPVVVVPPPPPLV